MGFARIEGDRLVFDFPEMGPDCKLDIAFHRTLRLPDDNKEYNLPPSLGHFELQHVDDHKGRLPASWGEHGGAFLPMWQTEAMWLSFNSRSGWPFAIKLATGKVNALTGKEWNKELSGRGSRSDQDYMTVPGQPWIDGFCIGDGVVRQFVAMAQGAGYTAEEQITGKAEHGGLQILVYPMKKDVWERMKPKARPVMRGAMSKSAMPGGAQLLSASVGGAMGMSYNASAGLESMGASAVYESASASMSSADGAYLNQLESKGEARGEARSISKKAVVELGLAAGGLMRQEIYLDSFEVDCWDTTVQARCFMHLVDASDYQGITGKLPRHRAPDQAVYGQYGMPFYTYTDHSKASHGGSSVLAGLDSVAAMGVKKGQKPLSDNGGVKVSSTVHIQAAPKDATRDGNW